MPSAAALPLPIDDEDVLAGPSDRKIRTALVIDGDPLVTRSLALMLGAEAFAVETGAAGADAVRMATEQAFDVIVLGADLPDMSGLEAMNRLRLAEVTSVIVFASVTPATAASAASLNLSNGA